jgi:hypothetical protein
MCKSVLLPKGEQVISDKIRRDVELQLHNLRPGMIQR